MLYNNTQCYKKDSNEIVEYIVPLCKSTKAPCLQVARSRLPIGGMLTFRFFGHGMERDVDEGHLLVCSGRETEEKSMPTYTDPRTHTREEISRIVDLLGSFWLEDQQVINAVTRDHEDSTEVLLTLESGAQRCLVFLVKPEARQIG